MNPYSIVGPAKNSMFVGYSDELNYIVRNVAAPGEERRSFFIPGARMGKTSLLAQIERRLSVDPLKNGSNLWLIPLKLGLKGLKAQNLFGEIADKLYGYLTTSPLPIDISSEVKDEFQKVKKTSGQFDSFVRSLDILKEEVRTAEPSIYLRIALLIDDLWSEKMSEETVENLDHKLTSLYTHGSLGQVVVYVITAGLHQLGEERNIGPQWDGILLNKDLHVLSKDQSLKLINEHSPGHIHENVAEEIYEETGGHPYLIQWAMSKICERDNLEELTKDDVSNIINRRILEDHSSGLIFWWKKLSPVDITIYNIFCRHMHDRTFNTWDDALMRMRFDTPPTEKERLMMKKERRTMTDEERLMKIRNSLRVLKTMGLIRENQGEIDEIYELAGNWPARWFLRRR